MQLLILVSTVTIHVKFISRLTDVILICEGPCDTDWNYLDHSFPSFGIQKWEELLVVEDRCCYSPQSLLLHSFHNISSHLITRTCILIDSVDC